MEKSARARSGFVPAQSRLTNFGDIRQGWELPPSHEVGTVADDAGASDCGEAEAAPTGADGASAEVAGAVDSAVRGTAGPDDPHAERSMTKRRLWRRRMRA